MVLESLESSNLALSKNWTVAVLAFIISSFSLFLSFTMFKESSSILSLAFVTIGFMPLIHNAFVEEEEKEAENPGKAVTFLKRHWSIIKIYSWFFIGLTISYAAWYVFLPEVSSGETCFSEICFEMPDKQTVFKEQEKTWSFLTGEMTGFLSKEVCLDKQKQDFFLCTEFIFSNNSLVLGLAILLSFLYGAGSIFLIGWNASVIGIFIGKEILEKSVADGILRAIGYLPHGMPELAAYFIGALAGGIISVAVSKKKLKTHEFEHIAKDVFVLLVISYIILFVGALIEAYLILAS